MMRYNFHPIFIVPYGNGKKHDHVSCTTLVLVAPSLILYAAFIILKFCWRYRTSIICGCVHSYQFLSSSSTTTTTTLLILIFYYGDSC